MSNKEITIACIGDDVRLTTGFGNVNKQILMGFHDAGFNVVSLGLMNAEPQLDRDIPFSIWPVTHFDLLGHQMTPMFLTKVNPDIVFILCDPGNLAVYVNLILHMQNMAAIGQMNIKKFPVIAYTPIEGEPIPSSFSHVFEQVERTGGKVVLYSPGAMKQVQNTYPNLKNLDYAYHGIDHANFRKYSDEDRNRLRYVTGLDNYFVVGSFGVNKRTKGFDTLIYAARELRDMKQDDGIKFYVHTNFNSPTMAGYLLDDLAKRYGVEDMFLWKPNHDDTPGGNVRGIPRESSETFDTRPETMEGRRDLFAKFSYIDRMNVLDLYVDVSQVEGWGLPAFEAMACGTPTISVRDNSVREEIYGTGCYWLEPLPKRNWSTWHTGVKLVTVDPYEVAKGIVRLRRDHFLRDFFSKEGQKIANQYSWSDTKKRFVDIAKELLNGMS